MTNPLDFYEQDIVFHKIYYFCICSPILIFFFVCALTSFQIQSNLILKKSNTFVFREALKLLEVLITIMLFFFLLSLYYKM